MQLRADLCMRDAPMHQLSHGRTASHVAEWCLPHTESEGENSL